MDRCPDAPEPFENLVDSIMRKRDPEAVTVLKALKTALETLPNAGVRPLRAKVLGRGTYAPTAAFDISLGQCQFRLFVDAHATIYPRDVDGRIAQLQQYLLATEGTCQKVGMLAAEQVSKLAREALQDANVAYFDLSGSLFISSPAIYILLERLKHADQEACQMGTFLRSHRKRIVRYMIDSWPKWSTVKDVAAVTGVSASTTSETLKQMGRMDWLEVDGAGPTKLRRLRERRPVFEQLASYCADLNPAAMQRFHVGETDPVKLAGRLSEICRALNVRYAVTGGLAAQACASLPFLGREVICRIEGGGKFREVMRQLGARPVRDAWNFGVIETVGSEEIEMVAGKDAIHYAPLFQIFLDLVRATASERRLATEFADAFFGG